MYCCSALRLWGHIWSDKVFLLPLFCLLDSPSQHWHWWSPGSSFPSWPSCTFTSLWPWFSFLLFLLYTKLKQFFTFFLLPVQIRTLCLIPKLPSLKMTVLSFFWTLVNHEKICNRWYWWWSWGLRPLGCRKSPSMRSSNTRVLARHSAERKSQRAHSQV